MGSSILLSGYSEHTLDPSGRVIIPRRLRNSLGPTFIITKGLEKCLCIFTREHFDAVKADSDKLASPLASIFDKEALRVRRHLFGEAVETDTDGQGRVLIPPRLREFAGISGSAVLVGAGDWIEIWNPETYQAYVERELVVENLEGSGGGIFAGWSKNDSGNSNADISQTGSTE